MGRWILLLPVCLFLRDQSPIPEPGVPSPGEIVYDLDAGNSLSRTHLQSLQVTSGLIAGAYSPWHSLAEAPLLNTTPPATLVASLVALGSSPLLPGSLAAAFEDTVNEYFERAARSRRTDPLAFLEESLHRTEREIDGYIAHFRKKEKVNGKYNPVEELDVAFRQEPFSVYMNWLKGARLTGAKKVVYVPSQNDGKLLALPNIPFVPIQERDPHASDAKEGSRFTIDQFGMHKGMQRTVATMKAAQARGALHLRYLGEATDPRVGVACYVFERGPYDPLEDEGVNKLTIFIDKETGLQVGSILEDAEGKLIAEYFFRDVRINPAFSEWQFTREALKKR